VLPTYRLDRPDSDDSIIIDGWSYVWAALAGPFYVMSKGFYLLAALMAAITLMLAVGAFLGLLIAVQLFDASLLGLAAMLGSIIGAFFLNGVAAVQLVHWGYLRAGWKMGY
jgi:hypothetical protein